jgi:hypothetical protein
VSVMLTLMSGCSSGSNLKRDREAMKSIMRSRVGLEMKTPEIDANIRELAVEDDWYLMKVAKPVLLELFNTEEFYSLCQKLRQGTCLNETPFEASTIAQREDLATLHIRPSIEYIKQYGGGSGTITTATAQQSQRRIQSPSKLKP